MTVPYDELDPGIREVVRLLNEHGFKTVDSGDGVSKQSDPGYEPCDCLVLDYPHVVVEVEADRGVAEGLRLHELLSSRGVVFLPMELADTVPNLQVSWDSCMPDKSYILIQGVKDSDLI